MAVDQLIEKAMKRLRALRLPWFKAKLLMYPLRMISSNV